MDRNRFNGKHLAGDGGEDLVAVPETELLSLGITIEDLGGEDAGPWLMAAGALSGVVGTTLLWALVQPTRFQPLVTAGTAASASCYLVYWSRSHTRRQKMEAAIERLGTWLERRRA
jgi:hypothetical protein